MSRHLFLADAQREAIETAHFHLDDREIARYWTLSEQDLLRIDRRRRDSNRFGFAVQLCLLRFPGWPPNKRERVPVSLLRYVAEQLEIPLENIEEYFLRQPTRSEHLQEIMDLYGFNIRLFVGNLFGLTTRRLGKRLLLGLKLNLITGIRRPDCSWRFWMNCGPNV